MKTSVRNILTIFAMILVTNLIESCELIQKENARPENQNNINYSIVIDETQQYVVYPNLDAESTRIPFTVVADQKVEYLELSCDKNKLLDIEFEPALDNMSGFIIVSPTESLLKSRETKLFVNIVCQSSPIKSNLQFYVEVASLGCNTKSIAFKNTEDEKKLKINSNIPYEISFDENSKEFLTLIQKEDGLYLQATENTEYAERFGTVTIKDVKRYLDDVEISITQKPSYGSRQRDSLALVKLYNDWDMKESEYTGMNGPMDYWLTDAPLDKWLGISCYKGRVRTFEIRLRKWTSNWEPYKYEIGETIGELRMLRQIWLAAQLKGELPQSLGQLTELKEVEIYGPNMITGNLENHPIGRLASNFKYFCIDGFFEGSLPEWLADIKEWRCDNTVCSGKVPDRVAEHEMMTFIYPNKCNDGSVEWPFINQDALLKKVDECTIVIATTSHYALWCGDTTPEGVVKVNGKFGEHYEWTSKDAMLDYLETTRGYSDIRKNLSNNVSKDSPAWENQYREAAGLQPLDYKNGIDW